MASPLRATQGPSERPPAPAARPRTLFMAERVMPNMTAADLTAIQHTLVEAARRTTATGRPVRSVHTVYVPSQSRWVGLFEAADAEAVRAAIRLAQVPFLTVEQVIDLPAALDAEAGGGI
ncbi:MAG TPA: nickel-binding protein [Actinocrinis sp.]|nr:nickel-binding protein [Actinocrinis sp.]